MGRRRLRPPGRRARRSGRRGRRAGRSPSAALRTGFDTRSRLRSIAAQDERTAKQYGKWSAEIRDAFLAVLRETGNAAAAFRVVGHASMFRKRRKRDPVFAAAWAAALAEADTRLSKAESPFPETGMGTVTYLSPGQSPDCPRARLGGFAVADPATLLRPMPKRKPKERGQVIRRTRGGRVQIALAQEGHMTAEIEAQFLALLRATGNFSASARALGFQPASLFERMRRWPAFAKDCDEAVAEASVQLDYALVAHAHKLLRAPEDGMGTVTFTRGDASFPRWERESDCPLEEAPFDPDRAMRILAFIDRRRGHSIGRGRRKGPPERTYDEAVASILAKIAAIERHEQRMKERAAEDGNGDSHVTVPTEGKHGDTGNGDSHE